MQGFETYDKLFGNKSKSLPLGGLYAGYNFAIGEHVILGLDANIDFLPKKIRTIGAIPDSSASLQFYEIYKERASASGRLRLGYAYGRLLPYIAGGLSMNSSAAILSLASFGPDGGAKNLFYKYATWNLGAGIDYAMSHNIILRADYSFQNFKDQKLIFAYDAAPYELPNKGSIKAQQLRFGVAYKF